VPPPDGSRDPRIEDPTNRWIVHLLGRVLLPLAIRARIPANAVSLLGLFFGAASAWAFFHWQYPAALVAGLLLATAWLIADGLDGMIARATGTTSATGRILDGLCDHSVFILIYIALATSLGTVEAWVLAVVAGLFHAVQCALYEGERIRFHRRLQGLPPPAPEGRSSHFVARVYDAVASSLDRFSRRFELALRDGSDASLRREEYAARAWAPLKFMWVLTNNMRVVLIVAACATGNPRLFWWMELIPLSLVAAIGIAWHKNVETKLLEDWTDAGPVRQAIPNLEGP
jgi:hypothetical protein